MISACVIGYLAAATAVLVPGYKLAVSIADLWALKTIGDRRVGERRSGK